MQEFNQSFKIWLTIYLFIAFVAPRRPNLGREGKQITLRANHFQITMPRGYIHHYDVSIQPDKCPRKVNREIIESMVHAFPRIFGSLKVIKSNIYTSELFLFFFLTKGHLSISLLE